MPELDQMKRRLTWTVYATPLMTFTTDLGLSIRVCMFKFVRLVTGSSSGSDHCPGRHQVFPGLFPTIFAKSDTKFFFPEIGQGFRLHFWDLWTLYDTFPAYKLEKN